jgi:hypothetical protein
MFLSNEHNERCSRFVRCHFSGMRPKFEARGGSRVMQNRSDSALISKITIILLIILINSSVKLQFFLGTKDFTYCNSWSAVA